MVVAAGSGALLTAIQVDVRRLHDGWMGVAFPRQRLAQHNVLGRWRPQTTTGRITYWTWYAIGAPLVLLLYPFVLAGFVIRFQANQLGNTARRIGIIGVIVLSIVVWGLLTVYAMFQLSTEGFIAVAAAGIVATVSAALAFTFARVGGRGTTVLLAYPFVMNAIFLPPVVAALYSPFLARTILPGSYDLAVWILDNILHVYGINEFLREQYTLEGIAYAGMWFGIAVPIGWVLGILVTLADVVRPKKSRQDRQDGRSLSGDD